MIPKLITYKHDKKRKLIRLKGRKFHDFTRILLEKVGYLTISNLFGVANIPTVQKN